MVAAGVFPSEERLERERASVEVLKAQRAQALQTVDAYEIFLDGVDAGDETVIRRLAAAQLGLMPRGDEVLERLTGLHEPPTRWIERSVVSEVSSEAQVALGRPFVNDSLLAAILSGEGRLWLFGLAIMAIFIGLLAERAPGTGAASTRKGFDSGEPSAGVSEPRGSPRTNPLHTMEPRPRDQLLLGVDILR